MKRIIIILQLFFYLIPAIGVSVSTHYCGGKLTMVSLNYSDGHDCSCGSKEMKKDCCKDERTYIKLKNEQQKTQQVTVNPFKNFGKPIPVCNTIQAYIQPFLTSRFSNYYLPPPEQKSGQPIYLLHQVFRV